MAKPAPSHLLDFFAAGAADLMKKTFSPCKIPGCPSHSLGMVCRTCSRTICQRHTYFTSPTPNQFAPVPICASCVVDEHRELWEEDPMVIEAELVD